MNSDGDRVHQQRASRSRFVGGVPRGTEMKAGC